MMIKELITKLFGIETYEPEYAAVSKEIASLKTEIDIKTGANDVLARKVVELEDKVEVLTQDPDKYVWQKISEYENEYESRIYNRGFSNGRMAAYSEIGIWNIEAHERGNCLAILEDGNIVELITNLETVYEEPAPEEAKAEPEAEPEAVPEWALKRGEIVIDDIKKM